MANNKTIKEKPKLQKQSKNARELFSTDKLEDLPADYVNQNLSWKFRAVKPKILALFDIKSVLTLDEILVGLARNYKIFLKKSNIICHLSQLYNSKRLNRIAKGLYERNKQYNTKKEI